MSADRFATRSSRSGRRLPLERNASTVLVVGGTGGIGSACVKVFADAGWKVGCTYHRSGRSTRSVPMPQTRSDPPVEFFPLDITHSGDIARLAARVYRAYGKLDALVFCQGVIRGKRLAEQTDREVLDTFRTNVLGAVALTRALLPQMAGRSSITYLASISAFAGSYDPVYAASKGALVAFAKSLARELGPRVRVNLVAPGLTTATSMYVSMKPHVRRRHLEANPLRRLASPEDVARSVFFLASDAAAHITGATLDVNGGEYLR